MTDWKFPMKPVSVTKDTMARLDLSRYTMERKFDGHRAIVTVDGGGTAALWTRLKARIRTPKNLVDQLRALEMPAGTVLDGEIWNPLKRGAWDTESEEPCVLTLWDCVREGLSDISARPLEERRLALSQVIGRGTEHVRQVEVLEASLGRAESIEAEARAFRQEAALRSGYIHGVVLKRKTSPRRDHVNRSQEHPDWLKLVFDKMRGWEHQP